MTPVEWEILIRLFFFTITGGMAAIGVIGGIWALSRTNWQSIPGGILLVASVVWSIVCIVGILVNLFAPGDDGTCVVTMLAVWLAGGSP